MWKSLVPHVYLDPASSVLEHPLEAHNGTEDQESENSFFCILSMINNQLQVI